MKTTWPNSKTTCFGTPIVDRTGLTGYFDLRWDSAHEGMEKAVQNQLGLELVHGTDLVEFLVVNKDKLTR